MKKKLLYTLLTILILIFIIISLTPFIYSVNVKKIYSLDFKESYDLVILFGAKVYPKKTLSPIMKQRADAVFEIYKKYPSQIIISGSGKYEVNSIERYLLNLGINQKNIIKDYYGYDTHDTIRHLSNIPNIKNRKILMVSQNFHLFRILQMAKNYDLNSTGIIAELISPYEDSNINIFEKINTKIERHYRGSILFWLYKTGIYDFLSNEAEKKEANLKSNRDIFIPNIY
ncbi:YdcF family protein [bacterium]|nr:YdcF family protein [bacterium]